MKLLIASDIHGSAFYCRKLLEAYEKENAQRIQKAFSVHKKVSNLK